MIVITIYLGLCFMIRRFLTFLMITLVAMQSVIAMADIHQVHNSNLTHQTSNNHLVQADIESIVFADQQPTDSNSYQHLDCNHCCHGACHFFIGVNQEPIASLNPHNDTTSYQAVYHSLVLTPDNPPPIS